MCVPNVEKDLDRFIEILIDAQQQGEIASKELFTEMDEIWETLTKGEQKVAKMFEDAIVAYKLLKLRQ